MATQECIERATSYVNLQGPTSCKGLSGVAAGNCKEALKNWYLKHYCEPINYKEMIKYAMDGKLHSGPINGARVCTTDLQLMEMAKKVLSDDERARIVVSGLGDWVIRNGKLKDEAPPFIPAWPGNQYGNQYLNKAKVRRTKYEGSEILSAPSGKCGSDGYWYINHPVRSFNNVGDRGDNIALNDAVYWISTRVPGSSETGCQFIGKRPPEASAFLDVLTNGAASPYFRFHNTWVPTQKDVEFAKLSPLNAAFYFMRKTSEGVKKRDDYFKAKANAVQVAEAAKTSTEEDGFSSGVSLAFLQSGSRILVPAMTVAAASQIVQGKYPLCSKVLEWQKAEKAALEAEAQFKQYIQERVEIDMKILEEMGLELSEEEKKFLLSDGGGEPTPVVADKKGPAWPLIALIAGLGFVGYKVLSRT